MIRVKRPKLQITRGMVAAMMICLVAGGVAALTLSNLLTANFAVYTTLPMTLSWTVDPSSTYVTVGVEKTGTLHFANLQSVIFTGVTVLMTVICPAAISVLSTRVAITLDEVAFDTWTGGSGTWTCSKPFANIPASGSGDWAFTFMITQPNDCQGAWTVSILLSGNPS